LGQFSQLETFFPLDHHKLCPKKPFSLGKSRLKEIGEWQRPRQPPPGPHLKGWLMGSLDLASNMTLVVVLGLVVLLLQWLLLWLVVVFEANIIKACSFMGRTKPTAVLF